VLVARFRKAAELALQHVHVLVCGDGGRRHEVLARQPLPAQRRRVDAKESLLALTDRRPTGGLERMTAVSAK